MLASLVWTLKLITRLLVSSYYNIRSLFCAMLQRFSINHMSCVGVTCCLWKVPLCVLCPKIYTEIFGAGAS